jgi:hypothetical protein
LTPFFRTRFPARAARALLAVALLASAVAAPAVTQAEDAAQNPSDPRYFPETGFRIAHDPFWDFFVHRGSVRTFGYPVSGDFLFLGCTTQFFQRLIMQQCGAGSGVGTLNLLDAGLMPYTHINGSTFPGVDPAVTALTPDPSDPDYGVKVDAFLRAVAPETFEGQPVNFYSTFMNTVTLADAFPRGDGDPSLLALLNLQLWGFPTSPPARDPTNNDFIYQRFQRGIMHYDKACGCTQGLLLADYLKAIITGQHLPPDLAEQARTSPLYLSLAGPSTLTGTFYGNAFTPAPPAAPVAGAPAPTPTPTAAATAPATPTPRPTVPDAPVTSPDYGLSMFLWGRQSTTARDLQLATDAGFRWQKTLFEWRAIEGSGKGQFNWSEADRVVQSSNAAGVKIIARLDFQPAWARRDGAPNGPPDNYQDFWDFVSALVARYRAGSPHGRVHAIEVWNEVNIDREWGGQPITRQQAADYVRLLQGAYTAAKAADPTVVVVTAGLSPTGVTNGSSADDVEYLGWLFDAGLRGGANYDVLGAHGNTQAPCVDCALNSVAGFHHGSFYFRRIEQLRQVQVARGDANRQVWLLEFGWTSDQVHDAYSWFAVSEDQKAQNVVRAFQYARQNWQAWVGVMTLWTLSDPAWGPGNEQYWWAITNPDGTARPAYNAVKSARSNGTLP